jgi:hypothetical protein
MEVSKFVYGEVLRTKERASRLGGACKSRGLESIVKDWPIEAGCREAETKHSPDLPSSHEHAGEPTWEMVSRQRTVGH